MRMVTVSKWLWIAMLMGLVYGCGGTVDEPSAGEAIDPSQLDKATLDKLVAEGKIIAVPAAKTDEMSPYSACNSTTYHDDNLNVGPTEFSCVSCANGQFHCSLSP